LKAPSRRNSAISVVAGLLMAGVAVGVTSGAVSAAPGTLATTNACLSNATATYSDLSWTLNGTATPSSYTLGAAGGVTLGTRSVQVNVPATLLIAGYNLGLLTVGPNNIPVSVAVTTQATNVDIGGGVKGTAVKLDTFTVTVQTVITDPTPGVTNPNVTATPLAINQPLPDWTVTPLGGNVAFSEATPGHLGTPTGTTTPAAGSFFASASVAGGLVKANFDCSPGTTIISPVPGTSGPTFTPAATIGAFENVTVVAPPTAPVCSNVTASVGVSQSTTVDLTTACTDVNEAQGGGSPFVFTPGAVSAGTLVAGTTNGTFTYTAPAVDPGAPVIITFTATDTTALVSAPATITITVLANQCAATTASCNLQQILVLPVTGAAMTLDKVPGLVGLSGVTLNGQPQVSTGAINAITITNSRGTAAGWSVTAYATDIGTAAAATFSPLPGVTVPLCSNAGAGPFIANPVLAATIASDRNCIPGDNLGWTPAAIISHSLIPGDVAQVTAGPASATGVAPQTDAQAWLAALIAAGRAKDPGVGVDGLGGLGGGPGAKTLCSAPVNHSGGTFICNAALYLGVPASAGAGTYSGGLVITLA
jgi:hypothetical protein